MRHTLVACMIATAILGAGCIRDEGLTGGTLPTDPTSAATALVETVESTIIADAPAWSVGYAWTIRTFGPFSDECTLPVVAASGNAYTLGTTCENMAAYEAMHDISFIGAIRKSDLAGAQGSNSIRFFAFPLEDGKTWTTEWDGRALTLTATAIPSLASPLGPTPGFAIHAVDENGDVYVKYDYSPAIHWWTSIEWAGGYGLRIEKFQTDWNGEYLSATSDLLLLLKPDVGPFMTPGGRFTVKAEHTRLYLMLAGQATARAGSISLFGPDGSLRWDSTDVDVTGSAKEEEANIPAQAGEWTVVAPLAYDPHGWFLLGVHGVSIEKHTLAAAA